ncbi:formyltransferase family protein [Modestobacter versicolor]|uniref:formyltransferase family protein n=1 Tax=Modestobacter versicolor TaxID=429133 RepID=UPI0021604812|nr:formyltransferase family protein [Modestobacter versicolor]
MSSAARTTGFPSRFQRSGHLSVPSGWPLPAVRAHLVDAGVDTGPVLAQRPVPVLPGDDEATLHERIKTEERELLVQTLAGLVAAGLPPTVVPTEESTR